MPSLYPSGCGKCGAVFMGTHRCSGFMPMPPSRLFPTFDDSPHVKSMMNLTALAQRLLDSDTKKLIRAGLLNSDLSWTDRGRAELGALQLAAFKKELVERAEEIIADKEC